MSKRINTKYKIDRRLKVNLWGRPKSPFNNRPYRPGEHGQSQHKLSDYGIQFASKQKLKGYYGNIGERKFKRYYQEAVRRKGDASENLIGLLESRLDAIVYRLKFVTTVFAARQLVSHGHVTVNGKKVTIPSYSVRVGDVIEVREKSKKLSAIIEATLNAEREVPDYLEVDHKALKGSYLRVPKFEEVPYPTPMEPNSVIEYYSR